MKSGNCNSPLSDYQFPRKARAIKGEEIRYLLFCLGRDTFGVSKDGVQVVIQYTLRRHFNKEFVGTPRHKADLHDVMTELMEESGLGLMDAVLQTGDGGRGIGVAVGGVVLKGGIASTGSLDGLRATARVDGGGGHETSRQTKGDDLIVLAVDFRRDVTKNQCEGCTLRGKCGQI